MARKTLITGGCRSGKSRQALVLAEKVTGRKVYVATAEPLDQEMQDRIVKHRNDRGPDWVTLEEPIHLASALQQEGETTGIIVLDCLTLWISNLLIKGLSAEAILKEAKKLLSVCNKLKCSLVVITNEVGAGIVPENKLAREFRDIAGEINQIMANGFDEVVHMVSGIPATLKSPTGSGEPAGANPDSHEFSQEHKRGLYEAIYKRRDVRHFVPRPVSPEVLGRVLHAAHHAGSVGFMQPWNFIVIDDAAIKEKVARNFERANERASQHYSGERKALYDSLKLQGIRDASLNICVTCDSRRGGPHVLGRDSIPETDIYSTCCAVQNLWLAARAEGLAVGWVSILDPDLLKQDLGIPDHVQPVAYLCLGHTEAFYEKPMLELTGWEKRVGLEKVVCYNGWQGQSKDYRVEFPSCDPFKDPS